MWVLVSLLCALSWATSDLFSKLAMDRGDADVAGIAWFRYAVAAPLVLPLFLAGIPPIGPRFWWTHLVWLPLELAALFLYFKAIRAGPLSLTVPYLSLTPVLTLLTGLFLGEVPSPWAGSGVVLVAGGSFVLSGGRLRLARPSLMAIGVAGLYSITAVAGKVLVRASSPLFFSAYYTLAMALVTAPFHWLRPRRHLRISRWVLLAGVFHGGMIITHMLGIYLAPVAYMIALKRTGGLFAVIYGVFILRERKPLARLSGAAMMAAGAALVGLLG